MKGRWIRIPPTPSDERRALLISGALAVGVGMVGFYVVRLLLGREPLVRETEPEDRAPSPVTDEGA